MSDSPLYSPSPRSVTFTKVSGAVVLTCSLALFGAFAGLSPAQAATSPVGLGTAGSYSVLAGSTVTNTGPTTVQGDVGVSPGTAITGFPPGIVGGTSHSADAPALQAQSDLVTAYDDVARRASTAVVSGDLAGKTLRDGVYKSASTLNLSGTLTLDGQGNASSVFVFQMGSALTTASGSSINLINGASACNIYWQVGSSATLGTGSSFKGTIMALTSVSVTTGAVVEGRALARNGQVSLDTNVFTTPNCESTSPVTSSVTPPVRSTPTGTASPTATVTGTASPTATVTGTASPTATVTGTASPTASPTATATGTATQAAIAAATASSTATATATATATGTATPAASPSASPSATLKETAGPATPASAAGSGAPVQQVVTDGTSSRTPVPVTTFAENSAPISSTGELANTGAGVSVAVWAGGIALLAGTVLLGFPMARRMQARGKH